MWTRKELKKRAKEVFKRSYWKCVLVAFILSILVGGTSGSSSSFGTFANSHQVYQNMNSDTAGGEEGADVEVEYSDDDSEEAKQHEKETSDLYVDSETGEVYMNGERIDFSTSEEGFVPFVIILTVAVVVISLIIVAIAIVFDVFIVNPIEMGCRRYFFKNLDEPANFSNVVYAFDHNFKNIARTMFLRDLYIFLWSLLFVIPGIIKSYEYRMIPYIMAENPDMSKDEAFAMSKKMMTGNKWRTFVLDLSFIGWDILSIFTCGLLSVFFVAPYKFQTDAALYEALRYGNAEVA